MDSGHGDPARFDAGPGPGRWSRGVGRVACGEIRRSGTVPALDPSAGPVPATEARAGAPPATDPPAGAPPATDPPAGAPPATDPPAGAPPATDLIITQAENLPAPAATPARRLAHRGMAGSIAGRHPTEIAIAGSGQADGAIAGWHPAESCPRHVLQLRGDPPSPASPRWTFRPDPFSRRNLRPGPFPRRNLRPVPLPRRNLRPGPSRDGLDHHAGGTSSRTYCNTREKVGASRHGRNHRGKVPDRDSHRGKRSGRRCRRPRETARRRSRSCLVADMRIAR